MRKGGRRKDDGGVSQCTIVENCKYKVCLPTLITKKLLLVNVLLFKYK